MAENVKNMTTEIVIDDGSVRVPIKNQHGDEIGVFYFHPTDIGIIERYNKIAKEFDDIVRPLEDVNIRQDGTGETSFDVEALREAEARLTQACDYLFAGNVSQAFFGAMHPFSPVGGAFYAEKVLSAVGNYIGAQFDVETEKIKNRVSKYTKQYQRK